MAIIRQAQYGDLFAINRLLILGREEAGEKFPAPEYPASLIVILNRIQDRMIWLAVEPDDAGDRVVGIMALRLNTWDGAPSQRYIEATHFYLLPEMRGKKLEDGRLIASGLIEAAKHSSVMASAVLNKWIPLILGVNFGDRAELKEILVEKHGFERTGANFIRIPSEDDVPEDMRAQQPAEAAE